MFTLRSGELRSLFTRHRYLRYVRVAVLDLGSTSFRLVVADWDPGIGLVPRVQRRKHLNLGMVVGMLPIMGIPLPLMSSGGTAVISMFIGVGLALSVRRRRFVN